MSQATLLSPTLSAPRSTELWSAVEGAASEACVLRAEGRESEAVAILQHRLPGLITAWSRGSGLAGERCQMMLRELFARVQQQVATAKICKRLVLQSLGADESRAEIAPRSAPLQVRRRVPLDDIPGMLDALDEDERITAFRRQNFPSSVRRPQAALAVG